MAESGSQSSNAIDATVDGPTIEESHAALVKEGIISDDDTPGARDVSSDSEKDEAADKASSSFDKFKGDDGELDVDALKKSYLELEKKQSTSSEDDDDNSTSESEDGTDEADPSKEEESLEEVTDKAGLDLFKLSEKWMDSGTLEDSDYEALEKAGYPKELVDTYARGLEASNMAVVDAAHNAAGGEQAYDELTDWAIENLSQQEQAAFDRAVTSGDQGQVVAAVKGLDAQMKLAAHNAGDEPESMVQGDPAKGGDTYRNQAEFLQDLNDPRYETSETFRENVMAKVDRSNI